MVYTFYCSRWIAKSIGCGLDLAIQAERKVVVSVYHHPAHYGKHCNTIGVAHFIPILVNLQRKEFLNMVDVASLRFDVIFKITRAGNTALYIIMRYYISPGISYYRTIFYSVRLLHN